MPDLTQITFLETEDDLATLYGAPNPVSIEKVMPVVTPLYEKWINASRFCVLGTYANDRVDLSPRGDDGPVVHVLDPSHIAIPDWRGNNRLDSLRNIMRDGAVSLMFMAVGSTNAVRVVGDARLSADPQLCDQFRKGRHVPKIVIIVRVNEVYSQCGRAILRAGLWNTAPTPDVPTIGDLMVEAKNGDFDGPAYDADWGTRASTTLWSD